MTIVLTSNDFQLLVALRSEDYVTRGIANRPAAYSGLIYAELVRNSVRHIMDNTMHFSEAMSPHVKIWCDNLDVKYTEINA